MKNNPSKLAELLAQKKKSHAQEGQLLASVERLLTQTHHNAMCGSWIATDGTYSLLVRCAGEEFALLLCDNSRCYKTIVREMTATPQGRRLVIDPEGPGPGGDLTLAHDGVLHCGAYGTFRSEEELLRQEMISEMEFAMREEQ